MKTQDPFLEWVLFLFKTVALFTWAICVFSLLNGQGT